jgi:hypothetical protein
MGRYREVVKPDVRRRMSPPMRQSVARFSGELGIHVVTSTTGGKSGGCRERWRRHLRRTLTVGVLPTS